MKISACMIAKNEELNITKCINSYRQYVNEIIVVDTGSNDETVQVARNLGAKVFFFNWNHDFAQAKNFALKKAKGDWIVFLDADEYFAPADLRSIICKADRAGFEAIMCELKNIENNDEQQILDCARQIRIFKAKGVIKYSNTIHEFLSRSDKKPLHCQMVAPEVLSIFHTGYAAQRKGDKAKRNLEMLLREVEAGKEGLHHYISDCYLMQQDYEKVIYHAQLHIDSGIKILGLSVKPYQNIIEAMFALEQDLNDIIRFINSTIIQYPDHPIFYYYLAVSYIKKQEYNRGFELLIKTLELERNYNSIESNKIGNVLPHILYLLGLISEYRGQYSAALDYYVESLQKQKFDEEVLIPLIHLIKSQKSEDVILFLKMLYNIENPAELDFLIGVLRRQKLGTVYTYFVGLKENVSVWSERPSLDASVVLLVNGKYLRAAELFLAFYEDTKSNDAALFSVVATILADDHDFAQKIKGDLPDSYKTLLEHYFNLNTDTSSQLAELEPYINVLRELVYLVEPQAIERYLALRHIFPAGINKAIANFYFQNKNYNTALYYFNEYAQIAADNTSRVQVLIGSCHYKLRSFANAVESFAQALASGYADNDIFEYLTWIEEACTDADIRQEVAVLKRNFHISQGSIE